MGTSHNKLDCNAKTASNSDPKTTPATLDSSLSKNPYMSKTSPTNVINGKAKDSIDGEDVKPHVLSANATNDKAKDSADGDDSKPLVLRSRDPNVLPPSASRKLDLSPLVDAALAKRNVPSESRSKRKKKGRSRRRR